MFSKENIKIKVDALGEESNGFYKSMVEVPLD